jgi:hypothetical protein
MKKHKEGLELLEHCDRAITIIKDHSIQTSVKGHIYCNMSLIYKELVEHKLSLGCLGLAADCLKSVKDKEGLVFCYLSMCSIFSAIEDYHNAKVKAEEAVIIAQELMTETGTSNEAKVIDRKAILDLAQFNAKLQEENLKSGERSNENYVKSNPQILDEFKQKIKNRILYSKNNRNIKFGSKKSLDQGLSRTGQQKKVINLKRITKKNFVSVIPIKIQTAKSNESHKTDKINLRNTSRRNIRISQELYKEDPIKTNDSVRRRKLKEEIMSDLKTKMHGYKFKPQKHINLDIYSLEEPNKFHETRLFEWSDEDGLNRHPKAIHKERLREANKSAFNKYRAKQMIDFNKLPSKRTRESTYEASTKHNPPYSDTQTASAQSDDLVCFRVKENETSKTNEDLMLLSDLILAHKSEDKGIKRKSRNEREVKYKRYEDHYDEINEHSNESSYGNRREAIRNVRPFNLTINTKVLAINKYNTKRPVLDIYKKSIIRDSAFIKKSSKKLKRVNTSQKVRKVEETSNKKRATDRQAHDVLVTSKPSRKQLVKDDKVKVIEKKDVKVKKSAKQLCAINFEVSSEDKSEDKVNEVSKDVSIESGMYEALNIMNSMISINPAESSLSASQISEHKEGSLIEKSYPMIMEQTEDSGSQAITSKRGSNDRLDGEDEKKLAKIEVKENNGFEDYLKNLKQVDGSPIERTIKKVCAAIKIQAAFRACKARKDNEILKEVDVIKSEYRRGENKKVEVLALIYLKKGKLEFELFRCEDKRLIHTQKITCSSEIGISQVRFYWGQILQKSEGNIAVDISNLIEQIGVKEEEKAQAEVANVEKSNDNIKIEVSKIKEWLIGDDKLSSLETPCNGIKAAFKD